MRMLPKNYADTAKMRFPSRGSVRVMARTLLMPHQGLRWQFAEQIAIRGGKATHFRNIPAMRHPGYRASGFCVRDKFMTDSMEAELQNV